MDESQTPSPIQDEPPITTSESTHANSSLPSSDQPENIQPLETPPAIPDPVTTAQDSPATTPISLPMDDTEVPQPPTEPLSPQPVSAPPSEPTPINPPIEHISEPQPNPIPEPLFQTEQKPPEPVNIPPITEAIDPPTSSPEPAPTSIHTIDITQLSDEQLRQAATLYLTRNQKMISQKGVAKRQHIMEENLNKIIEFLRTNSPSPLPRIAKAINVSPGTTSHYLRILIKRGIIDAKGWSKTRLYTIVN